MIGSNMDEFGVLALMFGYQSYGAALRAMDNLGDERSALVMNQLLIAWETAGNVPDLSHETRFGSVQLNPSRDDVIQVCTGMIDTYDSFRESGERAKLSLRYTVEALFELRAFGRQQPNKETATVLANVTPDIHMRALEQFPLTSSQLKKLRIGGYSHVGNLIDTPLMIVGGRCGFTEKQVVNILNIIGNYLFATVPPDCQKFCDNISTIGKDVIGDKFEVMDVSDDKLVDAYRSLDYVEDCQTDSLDLYCRMQAGGDEYILKKIRSILEILRGLGPNAEPQSGWHDRCCYDNYFLVSPYNIRTLQEVICQPEWIRGLRNIEVEYDYKLGLKRWANL